MKTLVTGATGFLGKELTKRLLSEGHEVVALGRNKRLLRKLSEMGATAIKLDLENADGINLAMQDVEVAYHCGGLSSVWGEKKDFYNANVIGTRNVVNAALDNDVKKLVHVSSPSVYIREQDLYNIDEDTPLPEKFVNTYAWSKFLAEEEVSKGNQASLNTTIIRPQGIIGAGDTAVFPRIIRANSKGALPLFRGGETIIDLTPVESVVEAMVLAATHSQKSNGQTYNITNGEPLTTNQIYSLLFDSLGTTAQTKKTPFALLKTIAILNEKLFSLFKINKEPLVTQYALTVLYYGRTLNIEKAVKELGFRPVKSVSESIREFGNDWRFSNV